MRRVVKRLDLRAVRLGDLLLHLLDCVDERLSLRVLLNLVLKRVPHELLLVLIIAFRKHLVAFVRSLQGLAGPARVVLL